VIKKFVERRWGKDEAGNEERIRKAYGDFKSELENKFSNGELGRSRGQGPRLPG